MRSNDDVQSAAGYLREAVPLMVQRNIPTSPSNFALWYSYVAENDPEFKKHLEESFPQGVPYQSKVSEELFYEYFIKQHVPDNQGLQQQLVSMLTKLFGTVSKASEGTREYGESLRRGIEKIQQSDDAEDIKNTLGDLLDDTDAVDEITRGFQSELDVARSEIETLREKLEVTEKSASIDELTQIGNRRLFDQQLAQSLADSERSTCLLLLDLDHFKKCNDTYGHVMGDRIISAMGMVLKRHESDEIKVARYGGEEFAVICDGLNSDKAMELAETIRRKVTTIRIKQKNKDEVIDNISVSVGVALAHSGETESALIERADAALYAAKQNGRNQVKLDDTTIAVKPD